MTTDSTNYIPFSQRAGLEPIPPQLKVGEASEELRRLLCYYIFLEIDRESTFGSIDYYYYKPDWKRVAQDLNVLFFKRSVEEFSKNSLDLKKVLQRFIATSNFASLFNLVEFLIRHEKCSLEMKSEIVETFVNARAAYRIFDNQYIAAIGTEEQAAAFERAIAEAEAKNASAARMHLIKAGVALRNSEWAGSVRESIHAVEAMAVRIAPTTKDLAGAIRVLETRGHLHGALKRAFDLLYAYSSNEEGIRHANILSDKAQVDEADALFMQGACASFVSYLLVHST